MVLELRTGNQTIINDVNFEYSLMMNELNKAVVATTGNTTFQSNLLAVGNYIEILRNGVLEFRGKINSSANMTGNSKKLICRGEEEEYVKKKCNITNLGTNGVWQSTASATIFGDILGEGVHYSAGTIETGTSVDFRVAKSDSLWNALMSLITRTNQEKQIDYVNQEIDILDNVGSSNVDTLNEKADFNFLTYEESEPQAKKVEVYGSGDGENQIYASAESSYTEGLDSVVTIDDPTIISESEAQTRADAELLQLKQNIKVYQIPLNNPFKDYFVGDTLTLNAPTYGISNDSVRIISVTRGRSQNNETLKIEVTNTEYSRIIKSAKQELSNEKAKQRAKNTYMQGGPGVSIWGSGINAALGASLKVGFYVSPILVEDEAGNLRINSLTVDYDVDPYSKQVGDASFDGADPQVENLSGEKGATITGTSGLGSTDTDYNERQVAVFGGGNSSFTETLNLLTGDTDFTIFTYFWKVAQPDPFFSLNGWDLKIENLDTSTTYLTNTVGANNTLWVGTFVISGDIEGDDIKMSVTDNDGNSYQYNYGFSAAQMSQHDHGDGSYAAIGHEHPDGSYDINAADLDDISISDGVSEASSVNSTSVNLYLDFYNGTTWVNKHSILTTGKIIDQDIDMSNNGTYPDVIGFWRLRVEPNSVSADYVQGIVKLKHNQIS